MHFLRRPEAHKHKYAHTPILIYLEVAYTQKKRWNVRKYQKMGILLFNILLVRTNCRRNNRVTGDWDVSAVTSWHCIAKEVCWKYFLDIENVVCYYLFIAATYPCPRFPQYLQLKFYRQFPLGEVEWSVSLKGQKGDQDIDIVRIKWLSILVFVENHNVWPSFANSCDK